MQLLIGKPSKLTQRLGPTSQAKRGRSCWLKFPGMAFPCQNVASQVVHWGFNQTALYWQSESRLLAGCLTLLLTLAEIKCFHQQNMHIACQHTLSPIPSPSNLTQEIHWLFQQTFLWANVNITHCGARVLQYWLNDSRPHCEVPSTTSVWHHIPRLLRLHCDMYISRIILDHSIILIGIFYPKSQIITWVSFWLYFPDWSTKLVTSPLCNLRINRSTSVIELSTNKVWTISRSVLVVQSQSSLFTTYQQETLILVAEQTTILSCSNGSFLTRWDVINIKPPCLLKICRVIREISQ